MSDVTFADLIAIYRATRFDGDENGVLTIADERMVATLNSIMENDELYEETQIAVEGGDDFTVGSEVRVSIRAPNAATMGLLVDSFDDLFRAPNAAIAEPERYYVKNVAFASGDPPPPVLVRYRAALELLAILRETASLVDMTRRELIFLGKERVDIPLQFDARDLTGDVVEVTARLTRLFDDDLHIDEKRTILQTTLIEMVRTMRPQARLGYIIRDVERIVDEVQKGYRLFTSSFSYSKVRNDVETARLDLVGKIHKTIVDIQGQLLGIPVATVVVVSQLKVASACDVNLWTNSGVLLGAWIFVGMLVIAVLNQSKTLDVIADEVARQRMRIADDFAAVDYQFSDVFDDLDERIDWHRRALLIVSAVLAAGSVATTIAFLRLAPDGILGCFAFWN